MSNPNPQSPISNTQSLSDLTVTWSTSYLDPASGRECVIGLSNGSGRAVLEKAAEILNWLDRIGAQPVLSGQAVASATASASAPMLPLADGEQRLLITKIRRTDATTVDLYAKGDRYKRTTLFDAGELFAVGIDPRNLPEGVEVPCRFFAVTRQSEKRNKAGNCYLDCVRLEKAQ